MTRESMPKKRKATLAINGGLTTSYSELYTEMDASVSYKTVGYTVQHVIHVHGQGYISTPGCGRRIPQLEFEIWEIAKEV